MAALECPVCFEFYAQAVTLDKCGHTLCHDCAEGLPQKLCPQCRTPFNSTIPNWAIRQAVAALQGEGGEEGGAAASDAPSLPPPPLPTILSPTPLAADEAGAAAAGAAVDASPNPLGLSPPTAEKSSSSATAPLAYPLPQQPSTTALTMMALGGTASMLLGRPSSVGKHVFFFDENGKLIELYWSNKSWNLHDFQSEWGAPPGAAGRAPAATVNGHCFYRLDDGRIVEMLWRQRRWRFVDHLVATSCPHAATDPVVVTTRQKLGGAGMKGSGIVSGLFSSLRGVAGGGAVAASAAAAIASPGGAATTAPPTPDTGGGGGMRGRGSTQLFFRSFDNQLVEMFSKNGGEFSVHTHCAIQGEPAAAYGKVFYRTETGELHLRVWNKISKAWETRDLEHEVGAARPVGRVSVVQFSHQAICIAYYRDVAGHVHEIVLTDPPLTGVAVGGRVAISHSDLHIVYKTPIAHSDIVAAEGVILYANEQRPGHLVMCVKEGRARPWVVKDCPNFAKAICVNGTQPLWRLVAMRLSTCSILREESYLSLWIRRQTVPGSLLEIFMPCHAWKISDNVRTLRHGM